MHMDMGGARSPCTQCSWGTPPHEAKRTASPAALKQWPAMQSTPRKAQCPSLYRKPGSKGLPKPHCIPSPDCLAT
jgi:hypothetical protein